MPRAAALRASSKSLCSHVSQNCSPVSDAVNRMTVFGPCPRSGRDNMSLSLAFRRAWAMNFWVRVMARTGMDDRLVAGVGARGVVMAGAGDAPMRVFQGRLFKKCVSVPVDLKLSTASKASELPVPPRTRRIENDFLIRIERSGRSIAFGQLVAR